MKMITPAPVPRHPDLHLIPYGREHDAQTVKWLNDPELQRDFGLSRTVTEESHRSWVESNPETVIWAITESGIHLGNVLLQVNIGRRAAYLQIYLGEACARGRGVGWAALTGALNHAFDELGLHRVWLHTLPNNKSAEALYTKAGFVPEGIERDGLLRAGVFSDQYRWSLISDEWNDRKQVAKI